MTVEQMRDWLDEELLGFPDRKSGEHLYQYLAATTREAAYQYRAQLVGALEGWLRDESEPRTMLALDLALAHDLKEMRPAIETLLERTIAGLAYWLCSRTTAKESKRYCEHFERQNSR